MTQEQWVVTVDIIGSCSCLKMLSVHHYCYMRSSNFNNPCPDLLSKNKPALLLRCYWGGAALCAAVTDGVYPVLRE